MISHILPGDMLVWYHDDYFFLWANREGSITKTRQIGKSSWGDEPIGMWRPNEIITVICGLPRWNRPGSRNVYDCYVLHPVCGPCWLYMYADDLRACHRFV